MDRAVSDVLGYILIFALITSSVGLVSVTGYGTLVDVRDAERFDNAERAFEVFGANVADHFEDRVPSRGTEIRLADASLGFDGPVEINVTGDGINNSTVLRPLHYAQGETGAITYTSGAVIRSESGSAVMISEPPFRLGNRTVITMVKTRARDSGISGSGRILVRTERMQDPQVHAYTDGPYTVTLSVSGPESRAAAWSQWLESETGNDCDGGDTVACTFEAETVYVRTVTVDVFLVD